MNVVEEPVARTFEDGQLKVITALRNKQSKLFHIPENYRLYSADGMVQAKSAKVDLDLEVRPLAKSLAWTCAAIRLRGVLVRKPR